MDEKKIAPHMTVLSPDFNQVGRWATIEMGLEDVHVEYF
jgi:hypothetical protein